MTLSIRLLIGSIILSLGAVPAARAGDADIAYVVTYIEAVSPARHKAHALLRDFGKASRLDEGNLRFEVLQRIGQPTHFAILEAWKDKEAQAAHAASYHTKRFRGKLEPLLRSPYDERPHAALAVGPAAAPEGWSRVASVYAVTHVDVVPTQKDLGIALVTRFSEGGRNDKGNVRFDALQQMSRPNHMTVVEVWKSFKSMEEHGAGAPAKEFREKLQPLSGSLYDERLYKALN